MLRKTDNIVIIQNSIIRKKKLLYHTNQVYIITYQHNKTQNNIKYTHHYHNITKQHGRNKKIS